MGPRPRLLGGRCPTSLTMVPCEEGGGISLWRGDRWGRTGDVGRGRAGGETPCQGEASPGRPGAREGPAGTENPSVHGDVGQTCWGEPAARLSQFAVQRVRRSACGAGRRILALKGSAGANPPAQGCAISGARDGACAVPTASGAFGRGSDPHRDAGGRPRGRPRLSLTGPSARALPTASISHPGFEGTAKRRDLAESVRQRRRLRLGSFTHSPDVITGISRGISGFTPAGKSKVLTAGRGGAAVIFRDPLTHTHT